jgi:hypothetical protein
MRLQACEDKCQGKFLYMTHLLPANNTPHSVCHYFVDEAGDPVLFNAKGRVIIGQEGCSYYFMLGMLKVPDPTALNDALESLRAEILRDPYFRRIPSIQQDKRKTALMFHAKDDIPEVRREVFNLLVGWPGLCFFAVVRDKGRGILPTVRTYIHKRYQPNEQYDQLIKRLFKDRLHKEDEYSIVFASRGKKDRTKALKDALNEARNRFERKWNIYSDAPIRIQNTPAHHNPCLQAADYLLWALQRCYEKREDRYLDFIWPVCRLIQDVDDHRVTKTGVYYTQKKRLKLEELAPLWTEV